MESEDKSKNPFDEAAVQWDQVPRRLHMARAVANAMIGHLKLSDHQLLLDYGTGTGLIAVKLCGYVKKIIAADSSPGMLAVLTQKLNQAGITSIEPRQWSVGQDIHDLPPFDVIVSSMTLHHIRDTAAVARAFYQMLVPGGQIAIADLDEENGDFHNDIHATEHNGFNRKSLQEIFEQAGFTSLGFHEAHTIIKPLPDGREKEFPIFLMTGMKP